MSGEEEDQSTKGDPEPTRMLARCLDKLDGVLVQHGFQFKENSVWENFAEELQELLFKHYDDLTGGDSDFDPNAPDSSDDEDDSGESESATLSSSDDAPKKIKNKK